MAEEEREFKGHLRIVASVEGTVGYAEKSFGLGVMGVLAITFEEGLRSDKVSFLEEVRCIWQLQLFLL